MISRGVGVGVGVGQKADNRIFRERDLRGPAAENDCF
jgi:hypothetical protein